MITLCYFLWKFSTKIIPMKYNCGGDDDVDNDNYELMLLMIYYIFFFFIFLNWRINAKAKHQAFFGIGVGQIWMDELQCTDADADLFHCSQRPLGFHNCGHNEDAGVVCNFDTGMILS